MLVLRGVVALGGWRSGVGDDWSVGGACFVDVGAYYCGGTHAEGGTGTESPKNRMAMARGVVASRMSSLCSPFDMGAGC